MKNKNLFSIKDIALVVLGALFSANAIVQFVQRAQLVPSGVAGITSLILMQVSGLFNVQLNFTLLYWGINCAIIAFVYKHIGKKFLTLSLVHVFLTGFFVQVLPVFHVTNDVILLAIFGGVMNGFGSTLALKSGGSAGGTDFLAVYFSMVKNKPMWRKIMFFNIVMLIYFGWQFDWTLAFYSIIYQMASTQIIDHYHDRYKLSSINIVTELPQEVSDSILSVVRHGITKVDGVGMYKNRNKSMLYLVVNSFEVPMIVDAIKEVDAYAFIEIAKVQQIEGNYRQRPLD